MRNEGRIPFSEFAGTYTERCISVLKSAKTERDRVQFWVREFGSRPIGQITRAELQDLASAEASDMQACNGQPDHVVGCGTCSTAQSTGNSWIRVL